MKKGNQDLLSKIGQFSQPDPVVTTKPVANSDSQMLPPASKQRRYTEAPKAQAGRTGRRITFYLHPADEDRIKHFRVWLGTHGERVNDSLVLKACLRSAEAGERLLDGLASAMADDKRFTKGS